MKGVLYLVVLFIFSSCEGQDKKTTVTQPVAGANAQLVYGPDQEPIAQVSLYIRRMFQDRLGTMWFGTNGDGVCRYDGRQLVYFNERNGFSGNAVRGILEDVNGDLWFATSGGVCRYDVRRAGHPCLSGTCDHDLKEDKDFSEHNRELAASFTSYGILNGIGNDQVWCIFKDRNGTLWVGTEAGVYYCDVKTVETERPLFKHFPIPEPDLRNFPDAYPAPKLINCIMQDRAGNIWFGSNGGGVYCYDPSAYSGTLGKNLTNFSEKDGLCNNFVQSIFEDSEGRLWFATRFGGLCRYGPSAQPGGKTFTTFSDKDGLTHKFMWTMLQDKEGRIWIGSAGGGLFRYDGSSFLQYTQQDGLGSRHVQSILQDKDGKLWFGLSGGLFRLDGKSFVNITKKGPWQ